MCPSPTPLHPLRNRTSYTQLNGWQSNTPPSFRAKFPLHSSQVSSGFQRCFPILILKCLFHPLLSCSSTFSLQYCTALLSHSNRGKITNVPQNSTVGRRGRGGTTQGGAWMSECATRPRGERVLECSASGALVTVGPRVAQTLAQLGGSRELAARGVARSGQGWVAAGGVPHGAAWCAPGRLRTGRRAGGTADEQGGGAVCTMAYPGHPGAGGGYYPGGVSAERGLRSLDAPGREGVTDAREEALPGRGDPSPRCSPRIRLAPDVHPRSHCILLSLSS